MQNQKRGASREETEEREKEPHGMSGHFLPPNHSIYEGGHCL